MPPTINRTTQGITQRTGNGKMWCYFVCLLSLLLSISPPYICRFGLCMLLIFPPLGAARRLRSPGNQPVGARLLWSLFALGWAAGVMTSGGGILCGMCFFASLLCWSVSLCHCVCGDRNKSFQEILSIAVQAILYDPWALFAPNPSVRADRRRRYLAWRLYAAYILAAFLIALILLLIQADNRIEGILRVSIGFALEKAPLILSCLVLAFFPAAFIYSFLYSLKSVASCCYRPPIPPVSRRRILSTLPWFWLCVLPSAVNSFLVLVEITYYIILKESLPLQPDNLYDILAVVLMLLISLTVLLCQAFLPALNSPKTYVVLGISTATLIIFAALRLYAYVYWYGLWEAKVVFSLILLIFSVILLCMLFASRRNPQWLIQCMAASVSILLILLIIIPRGLALTQINTALFLHKYDAHHLTEQFLLDADDPLNLHQDDLRLDLIENYGINAVPALLRLIIIDDVNVDGQPLGHHAKNAVLDCLCDDLNITRTGDNRADLDAVLLVSDNIPRYRLHTSYTWALRLLKEAQDEF